MVIVEGIVSIYYITSLKVFRIYPSTHMAGALWINVYLLIGSKLGLDGWLFQEDHRWDVFLVLITVPGIYLLNGWVDSTGIEGYAQHLTAARRLLFIPVSGALYSATC